MAERRRVVDAHVHFWDPTVLHYPWLDATPALNRAFLPRDLDSLSAHTVDGVVFVEANTIADEGMAEVDFVERLERNERRIVGIVAYVAMLGEADSLAALDALAARDLVVGVRHNIQGQVAGYCLQPSFVAGVQAAAERDLTFDLCITEDQLADVIQLVQRCPNTMFVLDHCGKPAIRTNEMDEWTANLDSLSTCANVVCKVSGLLTEASEEQRTIEALRPWLDEVHACFGVERLLYGSDWPVLTLAGGTGSWRGIVDEFTAAWSDEERDGFYAGNAVRTYGLEVS
jgi:L-fuconolactonase